MRVARPIFHQVRRRDDQGTVRRRGGTCHLWDLLEAEPQKRHIREEETEKRQKLTSASNHTWNDSSPSSPMPSKQLLTIAAVQPSTFFTIPGFASLRLIMNSNAAFRTSSFSSSIPTSSPLLDEEEDGSRGNVNDWVVVNGFATVGVGPGSELGSISAGRNWRRGRRWGWKRVGSVDARGVKVDINLGKWEEGKEGRYRASDT